MAAPKSVVLYLRRLVRLAQESLGDDLLAVYTTGSLALNDFVTGRSDIDIVVIAEDETPLGHRANFAAGIHDSRLSCPATGLELTMVPRSAAANGSTGAAFSLEVNTGKYLHQLTNFDPADRPRF